MARFFIPSFSKSYLIFTVLLEICIHTATAGITTMPPGGEIAKSGGITAATPIPAPITSDTNLETPKALRSPQPEKSDEVDKIDQALIAEGTEDTKAETDEGVDIIQNDNEALPKSPEQESAKDEAKLIHWPDNANNGNTDKLSGDSNPPPTRHCPGVICSTPPSHPTGFNCRESWTTDSINPILPSMGSKLDCCPVHICTRPDGTEFTHYGIESSAPQEYHQQQFQFQQNPEKSLFWQNSFHHQQKILQPTQQQQERPPLFFGPPGIGFNQQAFGNFWNAQSPGQGVKPDEEVRSTRMLMNVDESRHNRNAGPANPGALGPWGQLNSGMGGAGANPSLYQFKY